MSVQMHEIGDSNAAALAASLALGKVESSRARPFSTARPLRRPGQTVATRPLAERQTGPRSARPPVGTVQPSGTMSASREPSSVGGGRQRQ